jgi:hypothetical protein
VAHLAARITGADGYTALIALGEIAPQFEGKKVLLDHEMNGFSLPGRALRLIVPGDGLGGRSVRDVVRIDVEQTWTVHENEISRSRVAVPVPAVDDAGLG